VCVCVEVYMYGYINTHTHTRNNGVPVSLNCGTVVRLQANFELRCMNNLHRTIVAPLLEFE
jgi:hypothetical protein